MGNNPMRDKKDLHGIRFRRSIKVREEMTELQRSLSLVKG
jgi:hypothetical protein